MSKIIIDLSKRIQINDMYFITVGRLFMAIFIIVFQLLGMLCLNGWNFSPEMFFLLSTFVLSLGKEEKKKEPIIPM